jgi:hypothetical protein
LANIHNPTENIKTDIAAAHITLNSGGTAANTPLWFDMANYDLAWFLILTGTRTGVASITAQMRQRVGAGGGITNLGTAVTLTAGDTLTSSLWSRGESLTVNSGYTHVGILLTNTVASNFVISAILCRLRTRYKQATLLT